MKRLLNFLTGKKEPTLNIGGRKMTKGELIEQLKGLAEKADSGVHVGIVVDTTNKAPDEIMTEICMSMTKMVLEREDAKPEQIITGLINAIATFYARGIKPTAAFGVKEKMIHDFENAIDLAYNGVMRAQKMGMPDINKATEQALHLKEQGKMREAERLMLDTLREHDRILSKAMEMTNPVKSILGENEWVKKPTTDDSGTA